MVGWEGVTKAMHGKAWHGMAWQGMAWHGKAWHGMAWQGKGSLAACGLGLARFCGELVRGGLELGVKAGSAGLDSEKTSEGG